MATEANVRQRALDLVAQQFDPQSRQVKGNLSTLENSLTRDVATQRGFGRSGDRVIKGAYGQLAGQLQQGVGQTANIYNQGASAVGAGYDKASQYNNTALDRVLSEVNSNAQRLGLQAAVPQGEADLRGRMAEIEGMNQSGKASAVGNLQGLGTSMTGIARKAVGDSQREGASRRAGLQEQVLGALAELQSTAAQGRKGYLDELTGIESDRGKATRTTTTQLVEEANERERVARLDKLQEEIQRANLQLERDKFGQAKSQADRNYQLELQQMSQQATLERERIAASLIKSRESGGGESGGSSSKADVDALAARKEATFTRIIEDAGGDARRIIGKGLTPLKPAPKARPTRGWYP